MTDLELDGMLRRVLLDVLRNEEADREEADCIFVPSKNHLRQMKMMLRDPLKWMRNRSKPLWKVIVQKVAVVLLIASLGLGSVMIVSPTARAAVIRWVMELYETHITYRFHGETLAGNMPDYMISRLPEGFFESDRIENEAVVEIFYEGADGGIICFSYIHMQKGIVSIATTKDGVTPVTVNGFQGLLFVPSGPGAIARVIWNDSRVNLQFSIDSTLGADAVMDMAESVCLKVSNN